MEKKLPTTDPIDNFKSWAVKLGCPVNSLPSDAALNRFIKANHANVGKLMNQVQSKTDVKLFRDNFLLQSLSQSNLLSDRQQFDNLPNGLKSLKKLEKVNCQIGELKSRVERLNVNVKDKKVNLLERANQLKDVRRKHRSIQSKCIQLKQKHFQLIEKIEEEKTFDALLADGIPVPVATEFGANEKIASQKAIEKSMEALRNVYVGIGDSECTKTHRTKVEREIRKAMAGIPIIHLFEAMNCYSTNDMNALNDKFDEIEVHNPSTGSDSSAFDIAITKSRMKVYIVHLTTKKLKEVHAIRVEQYVQLYDQYLAKIIEEMKIFNEPDVELFADSICGDYLKQYGTYMSNQSMSQFYQEKLSNLQQLAAERDNLLKGSELIAAELSTMYAEIEKAYNSTLDNIVALGDVNKNMKQIQALSKYTINSFGNRSICDTSTSLLNCTLGQTVPSITIDLAPTEYHKELAMLVDVVYEKWNQVSLQLSMDIECQCTKEVFSRFHSLLTPNSALKELKSKWKWYKAIDVLTQSLDVEKEIPKFTDAELVSSNLAMETTKMWKVLEDIKFMHETGSKTVSEIRKYLAFLLDTSLGSFIPDRVMINRRNFQDYEEEFLCACSLISNSMKKN